MTRNPNHTPESGHFYDQLGTQVGPMPYAASNRAKAGQFRKPTLGDARKTGDAKDKTRGEWAEGVTSITGCAHRPQLEHWKIEQAVKTALEIDRAMTPEHAPHCKDEAYIARIIEESRELGKQAADSGSRIHAAVEAHYRGGEIDPFDLLFVLGAVQCINNACGPQDWQTELPVVSMRGWATKIDLISDEWVLDIKTKDASEEKLQKTDVYPSYWMQLAAGRDAAPMKMALPDAPRKCGIVYVSRDHPGVAVFKQVDESQLQRGLSMFLGLLQYRFALNDYQPAWVTP